MLEIFALSPQLREIVLSEDLKVQRAFQGRISLEEFIILPEFGQHLILRYEVHDPLTSIEEIDHIENSLRTLMGEDFWVTLLSNVYARVYPRFVLSELPKRLEKLSDLLSDDPVPISTSKYAAHIRDGCALLRSEMELSQDHQIWEVEVPLKDRNLPIIRVIGDSSGKTPSKTTIIAQQKFQVEHFLPNDGYQALMKAYIRASKLKRALLHYLIESTG